MVAMFAPLIIVGGMLLIMDETTAYTIMAVLGLLITIAHPVWLRNIYQRMMKRRYTNMEGFHASR